MQASIALLAHLHEPCGSLEAMNSCYKDSFTLIVSREIIISEVVGIWIDASMQSPLFDLKSQIRAAVRLSYISS